MYYNSKIIFVKNNKRLTIFQDLQPLTLFFLNRFLPAAPNPAMPIPSNSMVPGSGTGSI
jgi:hypothetical protein